ncbi:hypothetical protein DFAR_1770004 [Desulfarculales bacterium]
MRLHHGHRQGACPRPHASSQGRPERAIMPPVVDRRTWSVSGQDTPIPDVRLFVPDITEHLRGGLVESELFTTLPAPSDPRARSIGASLQMKVTTFRLNKLGTNAWAVPHLLLDGVALPVFTGASSTARGGGPGQLFCPATVWAP